MKKVFFSILAFAIISASQAQVKISQMPQYTAPLDSTTVIPIVVGSANYKINANSFILNKTTSQPGGFNLSGRGTALGFSAGDSAFNYRTDTTYGWEIGQRQALKTMNLPVPFFRSTRLNSNIALDIMPNGTPGDWSGNGISWVDICDADMKAANPAGGTVRLGITSTSGEIGMKAFNGATLKPLHFIMGSTTRMEFLNDVNNSINFYGKVNFLGSQYVQSLPVAGSYVGMTLFNTDNTTSGADAIYFIGNDFTAARFGFFRWSNGAQPVSTNYRMPNQLEILSNDGATNGMVIGTLGGSLSPIKFVQGSGTIDNEIARFSSGSLLLGTKTSDGVNKLQVNGPGKIGGKLTITDAINLPASTAPTSSADASGSVGDLIRDSAGILYLKTGTGWVKFTGATF
jgi:hypothetical protein